MAVPFFIGPKDFDRLRAADPQLTRAINFGMFAVIVVPLFQALKWVNSYLGNYGWSIVVLTVIINILISAAAPQHGVDEEDAGHPA